MLYINCSPICLYSQEELLIKRQFKSCSENCISKDILEVLSSRKLSYQTWSAKFYKVCKWDIWSFKKITPKKDVWWLAFNGWNDMKGSFYINENIILYLCWEVLNSSFQTAFVLLLLSLKNKQKPPNQNKKNSCKD